MHNRPAGRRVRYAAYGYLIAAALATATASADAGVAGRPWKSSVVRICFVGDALASKPDDVAFVMRHLKVYEEHGNIRFRLMGDGRCPPPRPGRDPNYDYHDGDLRIAIPGSLDYDGKTRITGARLKPGLGKGCPPEPDAETAWWSSGPEGTNKPDRRACRLTTWLAKRLARNTILHELGHAIGLHHEHERTDVPMDDPHVASCFRTRKEFGKWLKPGADGVFHITPYDRDSVMHYTLKDPKKPGCTLGNDKGNTGLSRLDKLTIRIMYPPDERIAEVRGPKRLIFVPGRPVKLQNEWGVLGALVDNVVKKPRWVVTRGKDRVTELRTVDFSFKFDAPGTYDVRHTFDDPLGRDYSNSFKLELVSPGALVGTALGPLL
jgi:hypothetical protein